MQVSSKITLLAELTILPGYRDRVMDAANAIWKATRKEEGCDLFIFNTQGDNENVILFFEVFKSKAAFDIHRDAGHTVVFLEFIKGKVRGDGPVLTFLNQIEE